MNIVKETCEYQCSRKIKVQEIFDFQLTYINRNADFP